MARATYVFRDGKMVPKHSAQANAAPYVHRDGMDPIVSMADGKTYDSKALYRAGLKSAGCIEVGNDSSAYANGPREIQSVGGMERDIKTAIEQVRAGYRG